LTLPSSGRLARRFAPVKPPLMSNVRLLSCLRWPYLLAAPDQMLGLLGGTTVAKLAASPERQGRLAQRSPRAVRPLAAGAPADARRGPAAPYEPRCTSS